MGSLLVRRVAARIAACACAALHLQCAPFPLQQHVVDDDEQEQISRAMPFIFESATRPPQNNMEKRTSSPLKLGRRVS